MRIWCRARWKIYNHILGTGNNGRVEWRAFFRAHVTNKKTPAPPIRFYVCASEWVSSSEDIDKSNGNDNGSRRMGHTTLKLWPARINRELYTRWEKKVLSALDECSLSKAHTFDFCSGPRRTTSYTLLDSSCGALELNLAALCVCVCVLLCQMLCVATRRERVADDTINQFLPQ